MSQPCRPRLCSFYPPLAPLVLLDLLIGPPRSRTWRFLDLHMERAGLFGWVTLLQRSRSWARHMASFVSNEVGAASIFATCGDAFLICSYTHAFALDDGVRASRVVDLIYPSRLAAGAFYLPPGAVLFALILYFLPAKASINQPQQGSRFSFTSCSFFLFYTCSSQGSGPAG